MSPPAADSLPPRLQGDLPVVSAAVAADRIADEATVAVSGFGSVGDPKAVPRAVAAATRAGERDPALTVVSGGSVGPPIDTELVEAGAIARRYPFQATAAARQAANSREMRFADRGIAGMSDEVRFGRVADPDVALVEAVAVGPDWFIPSTSIGQTPAYVAAADEVVVEVNAAQPRELGRFHDIVTRAAPPDRGPIPLATPGGRIGSPRVDVDPDSLRAVVRTDRGDDPYEFREPTPTDRQIATHLTDFLVREAARDPVVGEAPTLQIGVGSLGNALMSAVGASALADRELRYFGEVIQDGLLDLLEEGTLEAASATSLALSAAGQDRLFAAPERFAERVVIRPSEISNAPALIDRFGVVAINSALSVDLYGHVNSTHIGGTQVVHGVGGSVDFARNAHLSVVALPSTADDGAVSTIVPMAKHVDHTEHDTDVVVTEHGVADLRGRAPIERAEALIECAAPSVRPALRRYLDRARQAEGHVAHDFERAFAWQGQ